MRCSVCFAEMKQSPNGLECVVCQTRLEAQTDEQAASPRVLLTDRSLFRDAAILVGTVVVGLVFWGIIAFAPGEKVVAESEIETTELSDAITLIEGDESEIISRAFKLVEGSGTALLLREKGCQRLSSEGVETVQWLNFSGDKLYTIRPNTPGNWRMHSICPLERGGAAIAALFNVGAALNHVGEHGELLWTQIITANNLDPEHVVLLEQEENLLLVSHDRISNEIQMVSYASSGVNNWKQTLTAPSVIEPIRVAETRLGDFLIAWREPVTGVRLVIISTTGLVIKDNIIEDQLLPLNSVAQDDIGRTLMLLGHEEVGIELVSQSGVSESQRVLATAATPLGLIVYEGTFFVFAASQSHLMIWGMDARGTLSERKDIRIDAQIISGAARRVNEVESILSLQTDNAASMELVIDLRRLANGLNYETTDPAFDIDALAELAPEREMNADTEPMDVTTLSAIDISELGERATSSMSSERLNEAPIVEARSINDSPLIEHILSTTETKVKESDATTPTEDQLSEPAPALSLPVLAETNAPLRARCTFTCISFNEPIAEYVLMQSVERHEGESINDVSLRLNDTHVNLCTLSGGAPEPTFERECREE